MKIINAIANKTSIQWTLGSQIDCSNQKILSYFFYSCTALSPFIYFDSFLYGIFLISFTLARHCPPLSTLILFSMVSIIRILLLH